MIDIQRYKYKGITSIVETYNGDEGSRDLTIPGPVIGDDNRVGNHELFAKNAWNARFQIGGTNEARLVFGPERKYDYEKLINTNMSDLLVGGIAIQGYPGLLANWGRFTLWNKKRNAFGILEVGPDDKFGDIFELEDNYTIKFRKLTGFPDADHVAKAKAAGVIEADNTINGVFPKTMVTSPFIQTHNNPTQSICFSYYPPSRHGYNAYQHWNASMHVKLAGEEKVISSKGLGVNYLIPIVEIEANIENVGLKTLEAGVPYTMTSNKIQLASNQDSYLLHIHEINTQ